MFAVQNTLGQLDWWELEGVITDACDVLPYRANYVVSGIATFEQVTRQSRMGVCCPTETGGDGGNHGTLQRRKQRRWSSPWVW